MCNKPLRLIRGNAVTASQAGYASSILVARIQYHGFSQRQTAYAPPANTKWIGKYSSIIQQLPDFACCEDRVKFKRQNRNICRSIIIIRGP